MGVFGSQRDTDGFTCTLDSSQSRLEAMNLSPESLIEVPKKFKKGTYNRNINQKKHRVEDLQYLAVIELI